MNLRIFPLLAALALAAGCAQDRMSLEVQQLCAPTADCVFKAVCDAQYLGSYAVVSGYDIELFIQVANQSPNNEDLASGRVNSNDAHVTGAKVDVSGAISGNATLSTANQLVPAGGTAVIGLQLPTGAATGGIVRNVIRLTGYYDNGREFETGDFPLDVLVVAAVGTCAGTDVVTCPPNGTATAIQAPSACGTP